VPGVGPRGLASPAVPLDWEPLPWDTDFFGVPIGRAELNAADAESLDHLEASARGAGISCLYGVLDPSGAAESVLLQARGWRFVEAAIVFDLPPDWPRLPKPDGVEVRAGSPADIPVLEPLAALMAPWSRYAVDPRFGLTAAQRMQSAWLERAARAETGQHSLTVAEAGGEIVAFLGHVHEPPRLDAVGTTRGGSGAATYLMQLALEDAGGRTLLAGPIAARNVASMRYVYRSGFRPFQVEYLYHRWLDEE